MIGQKTNLRSVGGVEGHVGMLARYLAERGHEVTIFTRRRYGSDASGLSERIHLAPRPCLHTKHLEAITHCTVTSLEAGLRGFDIVHYHGVGPALTIPFSRLSRHTKVCVTVHDQDYNKDKWAPFAQRMLRMGERSACRRADEVIVVARYLQRHLEEVYHRTAHYVPNAHEAMRMLPPGERLAEFGLEPGKYLLFLARLVPEKGCDILIDAILGSDTPYTLAVVGGASHSSVYAERLRARAASDPRIRFLGHQSGDALAEVRSNAGWYVMPSLQEGLPLALLEALHTGLPVIATDIPAVHEVMNDTTRERITLVPPRDPAALRAAIERLPFPGMRYPSGAIDWPSWRDVAAQVEDIYLHGGRSDQARDPAPRGDGVAVARPPTGSAAS